MECIGHSGPLGIPIVAAYLVEKKQILTETTAPAIARIFIPLFLVMTVAFLIGTVTRLQVLAQDHHLLIMVHALLALATVLIVDILALSGIVTRLGQFGFSPNRVAALGDDVLLLVNLAWLDWIVFALPPLYHFM